MLLTRALLILALLLGLAANATAADQATTERQIRQLQSEIKALRSRLGVAKSEQQTLQQALERAEVEVGRISRQLRSLQGEIDTLRGQLAGLRERQAVLKTAKRQQAEHLGEQLALAYRSGRQDRLKLLLNQEQPERLARVLHYHRYFTAARAEAIRQYNHTLDELAGVENALKEKESALEARDARLRDEQKKLARVREQRRQTLAKLVREISGQERELAQLEGDRQRLKRVLRELQQALEKADLAITTQRFAQLKGRLGWPTEGRLALRYRAASAGLSADGILIRAPDGQRVDAVHNGRVVYSDWLRGYGLLLIIDHGDGYMSLYGHNQSLLKEVGDWVAAGEAIARVGDSGGQSRAGLYFAIRRNGKPQNPQRWLTRSRG